MENVIVGKFNLMNSPDLAQITIHVNNLLITYGKDVIKEFKEKLYNPDSSIGGLTVRQLIEYYGQERMQEFFTLIYGWDFNKKAG